jgi:hypothetical protein
MTNDDLARELITLTDADRDLQAAALGGAEAARRAFLIAQHADQQLDLQRRVLPLLSAAVAPRSAWPRSPCTPPGTPPPETSDGPKRLTAR